MKWLSVLFSLVLSGQVGAEGSASIASIKLTMHEQQSLPLPETIRLTATLSHPETLSENLTQWVGITSDVAGDNVLSIEMQPQPRFKGQVNTALMKNSFVVDFDEDSVQKARVSFVEHSESVFTPQTIASFVDHYISDPTSVHGFNIASVVAAQKSGDCTEYAVLSAALARSVGIPSRVVFGVVIVEETDKVEAYGHAWTEVWYQEDWNIVDAALHRSEAKQHFYLPTNALENEGPGFSMSVLSSVSLFPSAIRDVKGS